MLTRKDLFDALLAEREAHATERLRWETERRLLINAALADSGRDFAVRQKVSDPEPRGRPEPPREPKPQAMGL